MTDAIPPAPHECPKCGSPTGSRVTADELRGLVEVMRAGGVTELASFDTHIRLTMNQPASYLAPQTPEAALIGSSQGQVVAPPDDGGVRPIRPIAEGEALSAEDKRLLYASSGGPPPEEA